MKQINCMILDDEPLAVQLLENYIVRTPFLTLVAKSNSPIEAKKVLASHSIHLIFLDIQMPDLNGIDFASQVNPETRIIFTTAFSEYALSGFKANALDYLLKPFNYDEFLTAAEKARNWFELVRKNDELESDNLLFVKSGYHNVQIRLNDVLYFQGFKDYIKIYLRTQGSPILTLMTMKSLITHLPEEKFVRVHRSYIVPIDKISSSDKSSVWIGDIQLPVSESYKDSFMDVISTRFIK
jgi:DNA-binding LytR/AlgR family response regulator